MRGDRACVATGQMSCPTQEALIGQSYKASARMSHGRLGVWPITIILARMAASHRIYDFDISRAAIMMHTHNREAVGLCIKMARLMIIYNWAAMQGTYVA